jgi:hypothetical protein
MSFRNVARHSRLIPFAVCASLLAALPVRGQAPPAQKGEVVVVARISKQFIEDVVAREEIVATIPFKARVVTLCFQGVIDGRAKLSVDLATAPDQTVFSVFSKGTGQTYARGVRGPIVALAPVWGEFTSQTLVRFDGRKFTRLETIPWADPHIELDRVEGKHGGLPGRAVGHFLLPLGQLLVPRAEAQATPIAENILQNYVDELADKIVAELDRTNPVEKSMNRLFPETRDWVFQISKDSKFIQAAFGPRGAKVPALPENPAQLKDVRMELWMHSTAKEAQDLARISKVPLAKALIDKYLETELPELARLGENRSVDAVGPWLVITVGGPKPK